MAASTEGLQAGLEVRHFGCLRRILLVPDGHSLLQKKTLLTLEEIAEWPIITYDAGYSIHSDILDSFRKVRIRPNFTITTNDNDLIKQYVISGFGIAIVAHPVYSEEVDSGIGAIDVSHVFPPSPRFIVVRKESLLLEHVETLVQLMSQLSA